MAPLARKCERGPRVVSSVCHGGIDSLVADAFSTIVPQQVAGARFVALITQIVLKPAMNVD